VLQAVDTAVHWLRRLVLYFDTCCSMVAFMKHIHDEHLREIDEWALGQALKIAIPIWLIVILASWQGWL